MTPQKLAGWFLIVAGIPFGRFALDGILPVSYFIAAGLLLIFFGPERINDERVQQLKMKALFTAMSLGVGLTFSAYTFVFAIFPAVGPAPNRLHTAISAWDFLAGALAVSLGLFYFYRWQDARPGRASSAATATTFRAGGVTFHRAPWSLNLTLTSLLVTGVLLSTAFVLIRRGGALGALIAVVVAAMLPAVMLFSIRGYAIVGDCLMVRRLWWLTRVPLKGWSSATVDPDAMQHSYRVWGNGGAFSYSGRFRSERLGAFRAFVTDPRRAVVLRWVDRTVVISPAAPQEFVRELEDLK